MFLYRQLGLRTVEEGLDLVESVYHGWAIDANPMSGVVEGFKWSVMGGESPTFRSLAPSTSIMVLLLVTGMVNFKRAERTFVDVL